LKNIENENNSIDEKEEIGIIRGKRSENSFAIKIEDKWIKVSEIQ